MAKVKIITINTWKCDGNYQQRIDAMARQLIKARPHLVACQECFVDLEGETDTLKFLARQLHMNYLFLAGREKKRIFEERQVQSLSGLGILSVFPIAALPELILPSVPEDSDRKAQLASVNLPGDENLLLVNVHLTHIDDYRLRKTQAEFIADKICKIKGHTYKIVCGDFNATLHSAVVNAFTEICHAEDCYYAGQGAEPRYSLVNNRYNQTPACIDHLFALPVENGYPQFTDAAVVLNQPDEINHLYPSDHFGISATLITP